MAYHLRRLALGALLGESLKLGGRFLFPVLLNAAVHGVFAAALALGQHMIQQLGYHSLWVIVPGLLLLVWDFLFLLWYINRLDCHILNSPPQGLLGSVLRDAFPVAFSYVVAMFLMVSLTFFGSFLILLGLFFYTGFFLSGVIVIIEQNGPIDSMSRSWNLTSGSRLRLLGTLLVVFLIFLVILVAVALLFGLSGPVAQEGTPFSPLFLIPAFARTFVFQFIADFFWYPLLVLIYYNLRQEKEGLTTQGTTELETEFNAPLPGAEL